MADAATTATRSQHAFADIFDRIEPEDKFMLEGIETFFLEQFTFFTQSLRNGSIEKEYFEHAVIVASAKW